MNGVLGQIGGSLQAPEPKDPPKVGDVVYMRVNYQGELYPVVSDHVKDGEQVYEVEVKAIKTVKVEFE